MPDYFFFSKLVLILNGSLQLLFLGMYFENFSLICPSHFVCIQAFREPFQYEDSGKFSLLCLSLLIFLHL